MKAGFQSMDTENPDITLQKLGFEEGELEMFFGMHEGVSAEDLIQKYLEISRAEPYNLNWQSVRNATNAPYETGVFKPNGTQFNKHDIAKDVLDSFDDMQEGGYKRRKPKTRTRKTRKSKKTRRIRRRLTRRN